MNEKDFVLKRVIPLLKTLGFEHVGYTQKLKETSYENSSNKLKKYPSC